MFFQGEGKWHGFAFCVWLCNVCFCEWMFSLSISVNFILWTTCSLCKKVIRLGLGTSMLSQFLLGWYDIYLLFSKCLLSGLASHFNNMNSCVLAVPLCTDYLSFMPSRGEFLKEWTCNYYFSFRSKMMK